MNARMFVKEKYNSLKAFLKTFYQYFVIKDVEEENKSTSALHTVYAVELANSEQVKEIVDELGNTSVRSATGDTTTSYDFDDVDVEGADDIEDEEEEEKENMDNKINDDDDYIEAKSMGYQQSDEVEHVVEDINDVEESKKSLETMTVEDLKVELRKRGLILKGRKDDLIQRLRESGYSYGSSSVHTQNKESNVQDKIFNVQTHSSQTNDNDNLAKNNVTLGNLSDPINAFLVSAIKEYCLDIGKGNKIVSNYKIVCIFNKIVYLSYFYNSLLLSI